eukprot:scaffold49253_cov17-Tisochrysis_lutea.AAC.2
MHREANQCVRWGGSDDWVKSAGKKCAPQSLSGHPCSKLWIHIAIPAGDMASKRGQATDRDVSASKEHGLFMRRRPHISSKAAAQSMVLTLEIWQVFQDAHIKATSDPDEAASGWHVLAYRRPAPPLPPLIPPPLPLCPKPPLLAVIARRASADVLPDQGGWGVRLLASILPARAYLPPTAALATGGGIMVCGVLMLRGSVRSQGPLPVGLFHFLVVEEGFVQALGQQPGKGIHQRAPCLQKLFQGEDASKAVARKAAQASSQRMKVKVNSAQAIASNPPSFRRQAGAGEVRFMFYFGARRQAMVHTQKAGESCVV